MGVDCRPGALTGGVWLTPRETPRSTQRLALAKRCWLSASCRPLRAASRSTRLSRARASTCSALRVTGAVSRSPAGTRAWPSPTSWPRMASALVRSAWALKHSPSKRWASTLDWVNSTPPMSPPLKRSSLSRTSSWNPARVLRLRSSTSRALRASTKAFSAVSRRSPRKLSRSAWALPTPTWASSTRAARLPPVSRVQDRSTMTWVGLVALLGP